MLIPIYTRFPELQAKAKALANTLNLKFTEETIGYAYVLALTPEHLALEKVNSKSLPLFVDFLSKDLAYRCQNFSIRKETLARAIGLKKLSDAANTTVIDATAGLARDSFVMAAMGCHVYLLERSPILFALVRDAMERGNHNLQIKPILQRMTLIHADAIHWLATQNMSTNVIYVDPMFPDQKKTALAKKNMQSLQDILGQDEDADILLTNALSCGAKRVVVKRPRLANSLADILPNFSLTGSSSRFDIYLKR